MLFILTASIFLTVYVQIFVLLLLPIYIIISKQGFIFLRRKHDLIFLSVFWLLSILVTILNNGKLLDILIGVMMVFAFIAIIFITYTMTQRMFRIILSFTCFMSIFCFIVALAQRALGMTWSYGARYSSVFYNPNYYAFYISMVILFCIYNIIKTETGGAKLAYFLLIPLNLVALYLTECRTTFVVLLAVCPIMLAFCKNKRWLISYLISLFMFFGMALLFMDEFDLLPRMKYIGEDIIKRIDIWKGAANSIMDAPLFGRGYNTYARIHDLYDAYAANHSHNLLLELIMNFGIVGTLVLLGYFGINVNKIIKLHRQNKCHYRYALTVTVIACVILHGILDITMLWPQTGMLVIYVVGFSTEYDKEHIFSTTRKHNLISTKE